MPDIGQMTDASWMLDDVDSIRRWKHWDVGDDADGRYRTTDDVGYRWILPMDIGQILDVDIGYPISTSNTCHRHPVLSNIGILYLISVIQDRCTSTI